jgi:cellulose biosynthesis protein BcsQ
MATLALYSNKGGVGKTAAAVNLAYLAAQSGKSTLLCDLDPQSATTYYLRIKPKLKRRARGFSKAGKPVEASIKGTNYENLDLLPADFTHRNLDIVFNGLKRPKQRLRKVLEPFTQEYDLIILDCPPTINVLAENIFNTADHLLVPLIPTTLSIRAHEQLLSFLKENVYRPERVYIFRSMVDRRKKMHREISATLQNTFDRVLNSAIPFLSEVEQMGLYREPLAVFAPRSLAASAYQNLWAEIQQVMLDQPQK